MHVLAKRTVTYLHLLHLAVFHFICSLQKAERGGSSLEIEISCWPELLAGGVVGRLSRLLDFGLCSFWLRESLHTLVPMYCNSMRWTMQSQVLGLGPYLF